jgi:hypothetical protein
VQLGPSFSPTEDYICVSMYLLMCDNCKVKLTLLDASNVEVIEQDFNQVVVSHVKLILDYSIAVITFYLLRPLKLTNQNQNQIQSVQLFITFAT